MMQLTNKFDYSIRGLVYLATNSRDRICHLDKIASEVNVSQAFLGKIFQQFTKIGLVRSYRGAGGGFVLGRQPDKISLLEVVEAIEGPISLNRCLDRNGGYDQHYNCSSHPVWTQVQTQVRETLQNITLKDLAGSQAEIMSGQLQGYGSAICAI